jgi:cytochrome d ubiquinol oxidase subunit I
MRNDWAVEIPWVMGLIGTRSVSKQIPGIKEIKAKNRERIVNGIVAVTALEALRKHRGDADAKRVFDEHKADLGFGLLLKKYAVDVRLATPEMIDKAVDDTIPRVTPMFWSFRIMVGLGFAMLALFALAFWSTLKGTFMRRPWLLKWALWMLPAPWISCELGWFVAEYGRQPWTIYGVLPTHLSVSTLSVGSLYGSLAGFIGFYTVLLVVEVYLMVKFARLGPGSLGTGRYQGEAPHAATPALA